MRFFKKKSKSSASGARCQPAPEVHLWPEKPALADELDDEPTFPSVRETSLPAISEEERTHATDATKGDEDGTTKASTKADDEEDDHSETVGTATVGTAEDDDDEEEEAALDESPGADSEAEPEAKSFFRSLADYTPFRAATPVDPWDPEEDPVEDANDKGFFSDPLCAIDSALERSICAFEDAGAPLKERALRGADVVVAQLALAEVPEEAADEKRAEPSGPSVRNDLPVPKEVTVRDEVRVEPVAEAKDEGGEAAPVEGEGGPKKDEVVDRIVLLHERVAKQDRELGEEKSRFTALEKELVVLREKNDALEKGRGWPADDVRAVVLMQTGEVPRARRFQTIPEPAEDGHVVAKVEVSDPFAFELAKSPARNRCLEALQLAPLRWQPRGHSHARDQFGELSADSRVAVFTEMAKSPARKRSLEALLLPPV
ncbi:hypothetical protein ACHAWF_008085 [Thalassiosira exigua]